MAKTTHQKRVEDFKDRYEKHPGSFHDQFAALYGLLALRTIGRNLRGWAEKRLHEMRLQYLEPAAQQELDLLEIKNEEAKDRLARREAERAENIRAGRPKNVGKAEAKLIERQPIATTPPTPEEDPWKHIMPSSSS
jgi:hypothetical protein